MHSCFIKALKGIAKISLKTSLRKITKQKQDRGYKYGLERLLSWQSGHLVYMKPWIRSLILHKEGVLRTQVAEADRVESQSQHFPQRILKISLEKDILSLEQKKRKKTYKPNSEAEANN